MKIVITTIKEIIANSSKYLVYLIPDLIHYLSRRSKNDRRKNIY